MAQCRGQTKKGAQCKREAQDGSAFCNIHMDQEVRARAEPRCEDWDKEAIGVASNLSANTDTLVRAMEEKSR